MLQERSVVLVRKRTDNKRSDVLADVSSIREVILFPTMRPPG